MRDAFELISFLVCVTTHGEAMACLAGQRRERPVRSIEFIRCRGTLAATAGQSAW
ncbi:MAG: hypothetical protein KDA61_14255 [Planctomycetales bacterium]|nr:hypothetical protein [Planctomycetales bacterium]